jgi:hypothetical protein
LQYDKRKLTASDDDVSFKRSSLAFNGDLEGELFYDEEKVKKIGKSIILSNKDENIEAADLTTVRFAQRFSNRPQTFTFETDEENLNYSLGDVVELLTEDNQDISGNPKQGVRAQVTQIAPSYNIGRRYKISATTFNPYAGSIEGSDISINGQFDINLYTESGGPTSSGTFTFVFDGGVYGQGTLAQAITVGSIPSGSTVNVVCINGAILIGKGGNGDDTVPNGGSNGGTTFKGTSGVTVNVYLNGTTPDFGNGTYEADGYLFAPGGGGGGAVSVFGSSRSHAAGGGGAGYPAGVGGSFTYTIPTEPVIEAQDGTPTTGGDGAIAVSTEAAALGGAGGAPGNAGADGNGGVEGVGGLAGKAIIANSGTFNIYTDSETTRFVQGGGDAPTSIS